MTIGERIKLRRKALDIRQEDVAVIAGVSKQTIQKYETGIISNIPSDKIELVALALNVTPAYLMGWEEIEKEPSEDSPLSKEKRMLIDIVMKMSDDDVHALLVLLRQKTQ